MPYMNQNREIANQRFWGCGRLAHQGTAYQGTALVTVSKQQRGTPENCPRHRQQAGNSEEHHSLTHNPLNKCQKNNFFGTCHFFLALWCVLSIGFTGGFDSFFGTFGTFGTCKNTLYESES